MTAIDGPYSVTLDGANGATRRLVGGRSGDFWLDQACFSEHMLAVLTLRMVDLLRIAAAVHAADSIARRPRRAPSGWSRTLHLIRLPVSKQCGVCPACIFRRQAMSTSGIDEAGETYRHNLFGDAEAANRVEPRRLLPLKAFSVQANKLAALDEGDAPHFFRNHLVGTEVVGRGEPLAPYVALFRRYRREWLDLAGRGRSRGLAWADLLSPAVTASPSYN